MLKLLALIPAYSLLVVLQLTLGPMLPGLDGPPNFLLIPSVVALALHPSMLILALTALCASGFDLLNGTGVAHLVAYLLALVPVYLFSQRQVGHPGAFSRMLIFVGGATLLCEAGMMLFFMYRPWAALQHFSRDILALLGYHLILAVMLWPGVRGIFALLHYRPLPRYQPPDRRRRR